MIRYIEAPEEAYFDVASIFLAGGITNCPDWQKEMVELLKDLNITIYNPRREHFPIDVAGEALRQIEWEFKFLDIADMILFWFSRGSLNPIVLFEYGKWLMNTQSQKRYKPIFIGIDPEYSRRRDVEIQTMLENGILFGRICYSLESLANQIKEALNYHDF